MPRCLFASDLHGSTSRYHALFAAIDDERPDVVLLGGDLLPHAGLQFTSLDDHHRDFLGAFLDPQLTALRERLGDAFPTLLVILGNDDPRIEEATVLEMAERGLWTYLHQRRVEVDGVPFYGYSMVPPTPFPLKDWERYDVSRFVDPGCVSPEEGRRTMPISARDAEWRTIKEDLATLANDDDQSGAVWLFHSPPYQTPLDRAALDGLTYDHAPLDVHVGSIAIRRFIEDRQPAVTLHGHIHEAARLTGTWRTTLGETHCLGGAHHDVELALVRFDTADPAAATRDMR